VLRDGRLPELLTMLCPSCESGRRSNASSLIESMTIPRLDRLAGQESPAVFGMESTFPDTGDSILRPLPRTYLPTRQIGQRLGMMFHVKQDLSEKGQGGYWPPGTIRKISEPARHDTFCFT